MIDSIAILERQQYSVRSPAGAVQDFNERELSERDTNRLLTELTGIKQKFDGKMLQYVTSYLIQELVKQHSLPNREVDLDGAFVSAVTSATAYLKRMVPSGDLAYMLATPDDEVDAEPVQRSDGTIKRKKGAKKEMAASIYLEMRDTKPRKEIIAVFMEEIGMSKAGATTYFHNTRKEFGPCKT